MLPIISTTAVHCDSTIRRCLAILSISLNPTDFMKQALLLIALLFLIAARGGRDDAASYPKDTNEAISSKASSSSDSTSTTTSDRKHYEVKSGIIEMKNSMMDGMKQTLYFDDYGAKQATYTSMEMMRQKSENVQIMNDGWSFSYDAKTKKGTKMKIPDNAFSGGSAVPSPADLTDEMKQKYNYKELEDREILGKSAKGYSMSAMGMDVKVWTWNNVPLYLEMSTGQGKPIIMEATSIQTDVTIPADKFKVPKGVVLEDISVDLPITPTPD
jgi:hypothetical protein